MALDQGLVVGLAFLNILKAFNTVNHQLLEHLNEFGLDPATWWFESYLIDRRRSTVIDVAVRRVSCEHWSPTSLCAWSWPILIVCQQSPSPVLRNYHYPICRWHQSIHSQPFHCWTALTCALGSAYKWLLDGSLKVNVSNTKYMLISPTDISLCHPLMCSWMVSLLNRFAPGWRRLNDC